MIILQELHEDNRGGFQHGVGDRVSRVVLEHQSFHRSLHGIHIEEVTAECKTIFKCEDKMGRPRPHMPKRGVKCHVMEPLG